MIRGVHTLIYSDDAEATRAFLRDVLRWPFVSDGGDDPGDWLIFATGRSELGVHPTFGQGHGGAPWSAPRHHEIALLCDDLAATMAELSERGATFGAGPVDRGFGLCADLRVPGAGDILLYEPRHATAYDA